MTGLVLASVAVGLAVTDILVGRYQQGFIDQKREQRAKLEKMTWYYLRADIVDTAYTPDGRYRFTFYMENVFPEYDMYAMVPAVRAFIQVGPQWKEVPAREAPDSKVRSGTVIKLTERVMYEAVVDFTEKDYVELLPGFMHVKFENTIYASDEAQPKDEVIERGDAYFIHLRPIGVSDEELSRLNQFPGKVPNFITMPPH